MGERRFALRVRDLNCSLGDGHVHVHDRARSHVSAGDELHAVQPHCKLAAGHLLGLLSRGCFGEPELCG
jgi:hypothetical protein